MPSAFRRRQCPPASGQQDGCLTIEHFADVFHGDFGHVGFVPRLASSRLIRKAPQSAFPMARHLACKRTPAVRPPIASATVIMAIKVTKYSVSDKAKARSGVANKSNATAANMDVRIADLDRRGDVTTPNT